MATRVLVLATYLSRAHAGAAHATMDICNALADTSWAEVSVFGYSRDEGALAPSIRYVGGRARPEPRFVWRFPSLYAERYAEAALREAALPPADLVYTQNTVLGLAYRRLSEATPVISHTGHVLVDRELVEEGGGGGHQLTQRVEARFRNRLERRAYAAPRTTHVVSTRLVARQREAYYGLPREFFAVRPLGVDARRFDRDADYPDVRSQLGIPPSAFVVATVARLVPWKNIDFLLRAAADAARRPTVLVVGDGPDAGRLRQVVGELGVADRVHFVGHTHPAPYLATADVFVLPSLIESFGMVYAEAMHMGLPCIGLRNDPPRALTSASDVIPEGEAGYCVSTVEELRTRLDELAGDEALRRRLGERAYALATSEYSVLRYCAFLRELADHTAGHASA